MNGSVCGLRELLGCGGFWHFHRPAQLELLVSLSASVRARGFSLEAAGYDDPASVAREMVEEVVRPYLREIDRYWTVGMNEEAFRCCLGVLAGLYDFATRSNPSFKEWAQDDPREAFQWVRDELDRKCRDETLAARLQGELTARCPRWA